tara:strand:+ start:121 stop:333 length:213 start_codon:yes stop_codon:yes gene_type:complete
LKKRKKKDLSPTTREDFAALDDGISDGIMGKTKKNDGDHRGNCYKFYELGFEIGVGLQEDLPVNPEKPKI